MHKLDRSTLLAFVLVTVIGGSNFVAVRLSNRELAPFWGAGLRFIVAAALLLLLSSWRRYPLPSRRLLPQVFFFGIVNFGITYACAYWGMTEAPAAVAATLVALGPLMTLFIAVALSMERFRWAGLIGAVISLAGVGIVFSEELRFDVPLPALLALIVNASGIATGTILLKRMPRTHPIATNAVAMLPGAAVLLALSVVTKEPATLPTRPDVTLAFFYLVTIGSVGLFGGIVYLLQHWTASATAYTTVLFPIVTVAIGAVIAGELVSVQLIAGAVLVMVGTYVGALAQPRGEPAAIEEAA